MLQQTTAQKRLEDVASSGVSPRKPQVMQAQPARPMPLGAVDRMKLAALLKARGSLVR